MTKVYCNKCKYFTDLYECKHPSVRTEEDLPWRRKINKTTDACFKNRTNNCSDFEFNWIWKFINWLKELEAQFIPHKNKGQSTVEYVILVVAILMVLCIFYHRTDNKKIDKESLKDSASQVVVVNGLIQLQ